MPSGSFAPVFAPIRALAAALLLAGIVIVAGAGAACAQEPPDTALNHLLAEARSAGPGECSRPGIDRLARILCAGRIRIGVREYYPQFGTISGNERHGYEIDVAQAIAGRLGVSIEFEKVKAATRIPMLASEQIDLVIATMGHNTERDGQVAVYPAALLPVRDDDRGAAQPRHRGLDGSRGTNGLRDGRQRLQCARDIPG